ncbi:MAG: T9SS type A sorting domain-containing protein [Bacteroidales bacterium]
MKKTRLLLSGIIFLLSFTINAQWYWQNPLLISNQTTIKFSLIKTENVTLSIFDFSGRLIETILSKKLQKGNHTIQWKPTSYKEGIYFIRIETRNSIQVQKVLILK